MGVARNSIDGAKILLIHLRIELRDTIGALVRKVLFLAYHKYQTVFSDYGNAWRAEPLPQLDALFRHPFHVLRALHCS